MVPVQIYGNREILPFGFSNKYTASQVCSDARLSISEDSVNGSDNVAIGRDAGNEIAGLRNVFIGNLSGRTNHGSSNIFIGFNSGFG
jgi:hypothetical protein